MIGQQPFYRAGAQPVLDFLNLSGLFRYVNVDGTGGMRAEDCRKIIW